MQYRGLLFASVLVALLLAIIALSACLLRANPEKLSAVMGADSVANLPDKQEQHSCGLRSETERSGSSDSAAALDEAPFSAFDQWIEKYSQSNASNDELIQEGVKLADQRREVLVESIKSDPENALRKAVPMAVRQKLPAQVLEHLEKRISARGDYTVLATTPLDKEGKARIRRTVMIDGKSYDAFVYSRRLSEPSRQNIALHGIAVGNLMAVHSSPLRVLEPDEIPDPDKPVANGGRCPVSGINAKKVIVEVAGRLVYLCSGGHVTALENELLAEEAPLAESAWTQGAKTVLIINTKFSDQADSAAHTSAELQSTMNSTNAFMQATSYGTLSMTFTYTPLLTLPNTEAYYVAKGDAVLRTEALALATSAGYNYTNYTLDAVCWNGGPGNYGGAAYIGIRGCYLKSVGSAPHEFGHNLGLYHSNSWVTTDGTTIGTGSNLEYGDVFDTMGSGSLRDYNAYQKNRLGWVPSANVTTVNASGTYRITAFDQPVLNAGARYALRIVKDAGHDYWLDFRQAITTNSSLMNGADLHWNNKSVGGIQLLDTTPGSLSGWNDAPLAIGRTFEDTVSGIYITPIGKGGTSPESLDLVVNLGTSPANIAPTLAMTANAPSVDVNVPVTLSANASDANGDALAYYWNFGDGTTGTSNAIVTKSWSTASNFVVTCTVSDMKGGTATGSLIVSVGSAATIAVTPASLSQSLLTNQSAVKTIKISNTGGLPLTWAANSRVKALGCTSAASFVLKDDGAVLAWGRNTSGELGDGTNNNRVVSAPVGGLSNVTETAHGISHSLALKADGTVWAWGSNTFGQLGDGTTTNRNVPVRVTGLSGVVAISCGWQHSLALKSDGTLWTWGNNAYGQLGDGTTTNRATPGQMTALTNIAAVAGGASHTLALKSDGTVWAWGRNNSGQLGNGTTTNSLAPVQVAGLAGVTAIACCNHNLALMPDKTVRSWGGNNNGSLGNGTTTNSTTPVQVTGLTGVTAIACGIGHSLALKSDGTVRAWGFNLLGQVGDGTTTNRLTAVQVSGLTNVVAIATSASANESLALRSDNTIRTWGYNDSGQLGDGTFNTQTKPIQPVVPAINPLPSWLTLAPTSATLAGGNSSTMTVTLNSTGLSAGTYTTSINVNSNDFGNPNINVPVTLTVSSSPALIITTASLRPGDVGLPYSQTMSATGGTPPLTWSISAGSVPAGLNLNSSGVLSGTPTTAGTANFTVKVTDSLGGVSTKALAITINAALSITTTSPLMAGDIGAAYSKTFAAAGGSIPLSWSISGGALPTGLALNSAGILSGSPTAAGTWTFTVRVSDSIGGTSTKTFALTINPLPATFTITASAGAGGTISPAGVVSVASGTSKSFSIAPSAGYVISAVNVDGASAGTVGSYTFTSVTANHTITALFRVLSPPVITSGATATPNPVMVGQSATFSVAASNASALPMDYRWDFGDGTSAQGASPAHTYASSGTYTAKVTVSDADGSAQSSFEMTVQSTDQGLIAQWKLDDAGSNTASDASGNGHTGTVAGGPIWTAGKLGGALSFDGIDDRVDVAQVDHNIGAGDFTWTMWVYPRRLSNAWEGLLCNGDYSPAMYSKLYGGQWGIYWGGDKPSGNTLAINRWYHLAVVRQGGVITFFQDGVQTPKTYAISTSMANNPMRLGTSAISTAPRFGKADLDDVRIYNRSLSAAEINALVSTAPAASPAAAELTGPSPMTIQDLRGSMNSAKSGNDSYTVTGTLKNLPSEFAMTGNIVTLEFGGTLSTFTLSKTGQARIPTGSFSLKLKPGKSAAFRAKLTKSNLKDGLSEIGFTTDGSPLQVSMVLSLNGADYSAGAILTVSSKGKFSLKK